MKPRALLLAAFAAAFSATLAPAIAAPKFALPQAAGPRVADAALRDLPSVLGITPDFSNPVDVGPKVKLPNTTSCTVTLLANQPFNNFTPATGAYAPPSGCPGPWAKVVLDWNVSVSGRQYDRLGAVWLGGTEIFHFTTSEPPGPSITWDLKKDVTEYANTLATATDFTVSLGNVVNNTYTGVYVVNATLTFYEPGKGWPAKAVPDVVEPISQYPAQSPPWFTLNTPSNTASATLSLPTNIKSAGLEVYTTGHGCDEFWYAQESTAYEESIGQTCGGTAYREIDVWLDGQPVGLIAAFPYLYTGAIDPIAWLPITGHDALNIQPYKVDLSPWVGILTNGQPHTVAVSVYNNFGYWVADADLLLTLDRGASATTGALTRFETGPKTIERVDESHLTAAGGKASYTAHHFLTAEGYVDTSKGRIRSKVSETLNFANRQNFSNSTGNFVVTSNGAQTTFASSGKSSTTTANTYPLHLNLTTNLAIDQAFYETINALDGRNPSSTYEQDVISAGHVTGKPELTTEHYILQKSDGYCFDQSLSASVGTLKTNSKSPNCNK
jgi:hypothetical protein